MARFTLTDVDVKVNAVDLSDYVVSCTISNTKELVDITHMGDVARKSTGSLQANSATIEFQQDFAASQVYATLVSLVGTPTTIVVKPTSAAASATNPGLTLTDTVLEGGDWITGSVGDLAAFTATFTGGSFTAVTA
jgi:hypothetical protein